ncbi:hypothetical protein C9374_007308 [Naegleria lovaniensis]|uniref:Uncharacterized protein n=1 Tax=Naegleria lovaniensis TaxID=51637 RepID=A0AA88H7M0_NAELO|nr:uncharacterized protein C9374_007308 [Naegleria lovaniensis]KAG2393777.1 hypothetical protein C9374_007308 [Naegleria lovaniensis]
MARTKCRTDYKVLIVNFRLLDQYLKPVFCVDVNKLLQDFSQVYQTQLWFPMKFYTMRGFPMSEFAALPLFTGLFGDDNDTDFSEFEGGIETTLYSANMFMHAEEQSEKLYRPYLSCISGEYPHVKACTNEFLTVIHPIHMFRYFELAELAPNVSDQVLIKYFKDKIEKREEEELMNENNSEEEDDVSNKRRKLAIPNQQPEDREIKNMVREILEEIGPMDYCDALLRQYHYRLNRVDQESKIPDSWCNTLSDDEHKDDEEDDDEEDHNDHHDDETSDNQDNIRLTLDLKPLSNQYDMLYCIMMFIGDPKTLYNFSIACRTFYEMFQHKNTHHELIKRLARDLGVIVL